MMFARSLLFACLALSSTVLAEVCLTEAPPTVYESMDMSPQNADYDKINSLFIAHPGWYNDAVVHYYKFRIFAPSTYKGVIVPGEATAADVPIQNVYLMTTTGGFDGIVGKPVIEHHQADGVVYSDFMKIHFVTVAADYVADAYKSAEAVMDSGAAMASSEILVNMPVVPTGSHLQDPMKKGSNRAPIEPVSVWYNCVEVWTYVFEVTDQSAADHFAYTRTNALDVAAALAAGEIDGFEIVVAPNMGSATSGNLNSIPIWHLNQYSHGVVPGSGGGPSPNGMRNVINLDRPDPGYSPLWQVFWGTELPIDYMADDASSNTVMTPSNGFEFFTTPMFVNCPNIGLVDKNALNEQKKETFMPDLIVSGESSHWILGSHMTLIFKADMPISFVAADGTVIGNTTTGPMGAYEYEMQAVDIPDGTTAIKVMFKNDTIRTIDVMAASGDEEEVSTTESGASAISYTFAVLVGLFVALS